MTKILDGRELADRYMSEIKQYISEHSVTPRLATILAGSDAASETYIKIKKRVCTSAGIAVDVHRVDTETEMEEKIQKLNASSSINGILVQLPLPEGFNESRVLGMIDASKDVDGVHPFNVGKLAHFDESMPACTAYGIVKMLDSANVRVEGSKVAILGRGIHVGVPLGIMLTNRNATVTVCHSRTRNLPDMTKNADIVIVAIGKPSYLKAEMIKDGAVIIDVGINRTDAGIVGDVDFESVKNKAGMVTPVPGGVGPMTVAMLARNTLNAYKLQHGMAYG